MCVWKSKGIVSPYGAPVSSPPDFSGVRVAQVLVFCMFLYLHLLIPYPLGIFKLLSL
jgi:hypothetical protein